MPIRIGYKVDHNNHLIVVFDSMITDAFINNLYPGYDIKRTITKTYDEPKVNDQPNVDPYSGNYPITMTAIRNVTNPWFTYQQNGYEILQRHFKVNTLFLNEKKSKGTLGFVLNSVRALERTGKTNVALTAYHVCAMPSFESMTGIAIPMKSENTKLNFTTSPINNSVSIVKIAPNTLVTSIDSDLAILEYEGKPYNGKEKIFTGHDYIEDFRIIGVISATFPDESVIAPFTNNVEVGDEVIMGGVMSGIRKARVKSKNVEYALLDSRDQKKIIVMVKNGILVDKPSIPGDSGGPVIKKTI